MSQMPEVNQDTDGLIRSIGHMLRAPLSNILQLTDLITFGTEGEVSEDVQQEVIRIRGFAVNAIANSDRVLDVLISLSRDRKPERLHLSDLVMDLQQEFGVQISCALPANLPHIYANYSDIHLSLKALIQILLTRSTEKILLTVIYDSTRMLILVSLDEGNSNDSRQQVSLAHCLHMLSDERFSIDLLLAQQLIALNGGTIWAEQQTNDHGLSFHVALPVKTEGN